MASSRTAVLVATGILAIAAAGAVGASIGSDGDHDTPAAGHSTPAATTTGPAERPTPSPTATSGVPTSPPSASASASAHPAPSGTVTDQGPGSEILPTPAGPTATATGYHLPPVPKPTPLVGKDLPKPALAKGRLVEGFPAALAPPSGATVTSSSVAVVGHVLQAALVASGGDPVAIVGHYRDVLGAHGYAESSAQAAENAPAARFTKGRDNVTVTTRDGITYLLANLRPDRSAD